MVLFGVLIMPLLSSCATRGDLVEVQRQLQTTRSELATVRKGTVEAKALADESMKNSVSQQKEFSRVNEQMKAVLAAMEAQQKAIASSNSLVKEGLSAIEKKDEERLKKFEEKIRGQEKGVLASQGNLGTRIEEMAADLKIVQGRLEENNNLLAEHGMKLDELGQSGTRSGSKFEKTETNLKALQEAQSSSAERLGRLEEQVKVLVKSWEGWREQADRTLSQAAGMEKRLRDVEAELVAVKESYGRPGTITSPSDRGQAKPETATQPASLPREREVPGSPEDSATADIRGGDEIYKAAYADYSSKNYELAISGFRDYLNRYPDGSLADNSQYWVGECKYSQGKFKEAIAEFEKVLKNYRKSGKAPDALLKKAFCYRELKDVATARMILNDVLEKYPATEAAKKAKLELANLK